MDATIATFMAGDGGIGDNGGIATYGTVKPTAMYTGGTLTITEAGAQGAAPTYNGAVVYFAGNAMGTDCLDASMYTGVQFSIAGTVNANCTIQFSINDSEHEDATQAMGDPKASGAAGSYAPQLGIPAASITATPTMMKVPFMGTGAPSGGSPMTPIDTMKLTGVQWQVTIPMGTAMCMATLQISNLSFY
jgi:hypothetical protein